MEKTNSEESTQLQIKDPSLTSYQEIIVSSIGNFGRWQAFLIVAMMVPKIFVCWSIVSVSFTFGKTDWWKETVAMDSESMSS